jgi:hypothetical protein
MYPDNVTIEFSADGLRVKPSSITPGHLTFTPALAGHVHTDSLMAHGWQIDDNGTIFSQSTFIHSDGQISLGLAPDVIKLDGMHSTHRLWVGAVMPEDAPFSITKAGAMTATSGDIGGWAIGATELSADSGDAFIDSSIPAIGLGATGYLTGVGFWVGYDTDAYKFFIGDPDGAYLSWDGDSLNMAMPVFDDETLEQLTMRTTIMTFSGILTVSDSPFRIHNLLPNHQNILKVFLSVDTCPTGASIIVDIHLDGTTIFTNQAHRPVIAASQYTGHTDLDITDVSSWPADGYLTAHVDQVGSTIAGANLVVHVLTRYTIIHVM